MTTSVIEASALCRVFASEDGREPVRAVDGVTFAVPPEARLVALIGPDGAGKSTLMQMICGLVGQDSGSLSVLGRTPDPDDEDFVNAVGYMPQTLGLYKDLSVMENMKLFGALRGAKPPEDMTIEAYYASLIALTGLEGFEGRPAGKLSGGMKQKLALAVALVRAPALLLLDEPTVGVDPLSRRELWAVIRRMVGQGGTTCFFSTAYLEEAESADWVLCMSEGRIIGSGTPAELLGRTKGRTYALDLSGFSDAERKSLSRRMMLKVSPAPEKSVFLDAVPRDGGIDLLLNAPNTREFAEREVELALRRDETGTVPDFDVLERAPRMEDAYALLTFTMETVRADDAASSAAPDPDDPGRLDTGDVPIRARDLSRTFGSFVAVADTTFDVKRGEIFGLLGPNGAGKSTTMNIITGYISATDGTVKIDGHDIADEPAAAKACIGYLPELPPLYQDMTVQEYLLFVAELKGTRKKADRAAAVEHAAARAGLQGMEQRLIRNLSKGYRQRVGIAAALLGTPKIIILDEPTVGLDPAQMIEIRSLIRDLGKTHTVILSSHILSEVQTVCDRVLIIAHGRLVAQGTPEELAAQLTAKGTITATAQGSREAVVAAAGKVPGLTDLRVTDEKGGEVSFTAVSTAGTDLRGALSLALAQAGCPVLNLSAETMSLEDVFLQLTETPESSKPESAAAPAENPPAEAAAEEENEKEANSDESNL